MKLGSICYLPPPHIGHTQAFLANLRKHRPAYPICFYSDHPWRLRDWDCIKVESPEKVKDARNAWSIPKYAFIEGVHVAKRAGLDFFLVLEPDCRVQGNNWDAAIFDEFFNSYSGPSPYPLCGGTFYAWNMFNDFPQWSVNVMRWLRKYANVLTPRDGAMPSVMFFGQPGCAEYSDANIFTNGALTVLKTADMVYLFPEEKKEMLSRSTTAYDASIGYGLKGLYGYNIFDHLVPLQSVFSYYGNRLVDETVRKTMLTNGLVRAVHQIKDNWEGP